MENWKVVKGETVNLGVYRINQHAVLPIFATNGSACFDMCASTVDTEKVKAYTDNQENITAIPVYNDTVRLYCGFRAMIPTGIIFDIPEGYSVRLHARSGLALKNGIVLVNQEAVIDSDYVNETFILLENTSKVPFDITHGMRICQGELVENVKTIIKEVHIPPVERDRTGGFGSTGV